MWQVIDTVRTGEQTLIKSVETVIDWLTDLKVEKILFDTKLALSIQNAYLIT